MIFTVNTFVHVVVEFKIVLCQYQWVVAKIW